MKKKKITIYPICSGECFLLSVIGGDTIFLELCLHVVGVFLSCCIILFSQITFLVSGMVYPGFGIVYAKGISAFSLTDNEARRQAGDRVALWYVYSLAENP